MGEKKVLAIIGIFLLLVIPVLSIVKAECVEGVDTETNSTCSVSILAEEIADPEINIDVLDTSITLGDEAEFSISIDYEGEIISIKIEYGDDNADFLTITSNNHYSEQYGYEDSGSYKIKLTVKTEEGSFSKTSETITVEEPEIEDEDPELELISPSNNLLIKTDKLTFKFKATDDFKLLKCVYEIYKKEGSWKTLEYNTSVNNPTNNTEYEVSLQEFDDGNYTWYVTCTDNNSQETSQNRALTVQTTSHEREKELLQLIENIDDFVKAESSRSLEENEVLEELGINEDLTYYKKRLIQINQDLGNNIKFLSDEVLREKRKAETIEEYEKIKKEIPKNIEIIENKEYIKNEIIQNLDEVTTKYVEGKKLTLDERKIKKLAKKNVELQDKITVTVNVQKIKITYNGSTEDFSLIKKEFKINDPTITTLLEIIPENIDDEIKFNTPASEISENLYEIKIEDLDSNEIEYIIGGEQTLNNLKNSETIIFEETPINKNGITGYFVFTEGVESNPLYAIMILSVFLIFLFGSRQGIKQIVFVKYKNEENCRKTIYSLKQSFEAIKNEDLEKAKEEYHKIKEIYKDLPELFKKNIFEKIEKLRIEIDKREMREFIREFEKAKKEKRVEDSKLIYEKIKAKYKKLPEKYQLKVYEKIILKN